MGLPLQAEAQFSQSFWYRPTRRGLLLSTHRERKIPWHFLKHRDVLYLQYRHLITKLRLRYPADISKHICPRSPRCYPRTSATLLLILFNIPGIVCVFLLRLPERQQTLSHFQRQLWSSIPAISSATIRVSLLGFNFKKEAWHS